MNDLKSEYFDPKSFRDDLAKSDGERVISESLSTKPALLYWVMCASGGHSRFVFREFPLGPKFKVDYVVLNSYSGRWEVKFIELEPVNGKVFTKAGNPASRLAGALKQLDDWEEYYSANTLHVRNTLVDWAATKDILKYSPGVNPCNYTCDFLSDPNSVLFDSYHIVIGRREEMSRDNSRRTATYSKRGRNIMSYDRLADFADQRYRDKRLFA